MPTIPVEYIYGAAGFLALVGSTILWLRWRRGRQTYQSPLAILGREK